MTDRRLAFALALVAFALGLVLRLHEFTVSLSVDEFATLWTVEGSLAETVARSLAYNAQSPFYYLVAWTSVSVFGESEWALRLPSLLCGVATVAALYGVGRELAGRRCGFVAAVLAWFSPHVMLMSSNARAYSLALVFAALLLLGFLRAVRSGSRRDRALFCVGGLGLFYAHYVLGLLAGGVGLAYLLCRDLRETYRPRAFAVDVAIQAAFAVPGLLHLRALKARSGELSFLGTPDATVPFGVVGVLLVLAVAGWLFGERETLRRGPAVTLALAVAFPVVAIVAVSFVGVNLLAPRYLVAAILPASVLGAWGVTALPRRWAIAMGLVWLLATVGSSLGTLANVWAGRRRDLQDWRGAVAYLRATIPDDALLLYRSGLVEEDRHPRRDRYPATLAPLRSPGADSPPWTVVSLTYRWDVPGRAKYFERVVTPVLEGRATVYLLSRNNGFGDYPREMRRWLEESEPIPFQWVALEDGWPGLTLLEGSRAPGGRRTVGPR